MSAQLPPHAQGLYEVQQTIATADAVAFAFTDLGDPVLYPYKYKGIGDEEVRIQVTYTGLCQSDVLTVRGNWYPCTLPLCPGHEVVGYVSLLGSKVTTFKKGDRVGVNPQRNFCGKCGHCKEGNNNLCGTMEWLYDPYFGGYSTHIQLPSKMVFQLPAGFNEALGSPLLCAGVTVFAPLKRFYKPNGRCAVIGIGGLGHLAVQYAAKMGMTVTAFTSSLNKTEEAKSLGATSVVQSLDLASVQKEEGKFDLVLNTIHIIDADPKLTRAYQRLCKINGTFVQLGNPDKKFIMKLDHYYIIMKQIRVAGSIIGSYQETQDMLNFSSEHNIYPLCETFKFEEFPAAFKQLEHGRPKFRCVVNVIDYAKANGLEK